MKQAILKIFGPKPEVAVDRALGRVLAGKPSELARDLVNDINEDLDCDKCAAVVASLWKRSPFKCEGWNRTYEVQQK